MIRCKVTKVQKSALIKFVFKGNPIIFIGNPFIFKGNPFIFKGNPLSSQDFTGAVTSAFETVPNSIL